MKKQLEHFSMDKTGKTRIEVPGRSAGDGMENSNIPEFEDKSWSNSSAFNNLQNKPFVTPPPKLKGPKFVPYEPYKAAVSPIIPISKQKEKQAVSNFVIDSQKVSSLASSIIDFYSNLENKELSSNGLVKSEESKCNVDCFSKTKALEEKIKNLEKVNKELTSQYQVQVEVNDDLKKMLVASLGEDIQCKVQYMTEDKVHLGKEVLQLSDELEQSKEEIEKLSVQCNIWESKFKASSLMVKELAQWKARLSHKINDSVTALDSILKEHDVLFELLTTTHRNLEHTLNAFEPCAKQLPKKQELSPSLLQLAMKLKSLSNSIQGRLLGKSYCDKNAFPVTERQLTKAEHLINKFFSNFENVIPSKDGLPNKEEKLDAGMIACQVLPHICVNDMNLSFCKHCSGKIEIV